MIVKNYALKYLQSGKRKNCVATQWGNATNPTVGQGALNLNYLCHPQHVECGHKIFASVMVLFAEIQGTQTIALHFLVSVVSPV